MFLMLNVYLTPPVDLWSILTVRASSRLIGWDMDRLGGETWPN
jgi:hypothetical protein